MTNIILIPESGVRSQESGVRNQEFRNDKESLPGINITIICVVCPQSSEFVLIGGLDFANLVYIIIRRWRLLAVSVTQFLVLIGSRQHLPGQIELSQQVHIGHLTSLKLKSLFFLGTRKECTKRMRRHNPSA